MIASVEELVLTYLFLANGMGFLLMGLDKLRAAQDEWRIPERWFFMISLAGGALGVFLGMFVFHHKTSKTGFQLIVILALAVYAAVFIVLTAGL